LSLRMRPDLRIEPQVFAGRRYWAIKDPVSLSYFHLREEEYGILRMLDGRTSLHDIVARFERDFAPKRLSLPQLQAFLGMLHETGLVTADASGQGRTLLERDRRRKFRQRAAAFTNILAIRFRGIDPQPLLDRLYPLCRPLFSAWGALALALLVFGAATLAVVQFDQLQSRLPGFYEFFSVTNAVWIAVAVALAKVLHELGHGLTCKHFGGECHEMGVMFLVFTPCLYCNVSDAWMLPNKWQRIAISSAGMVVEVVLASVCTFLWWFSEPGLLNTLCLNIMFVCSVGTLLFNGNPLLKYDGYFVLADLIEVPNLRQQAVALLRHYLWPVFFGFDPENTRMLPDRQRGLIAAYGVASVVYRWFLTFVILWFCHRVLRPHGLEVLASLLAVVVVGALVLPPMWKSVRFVFDPAGKRRMNWMRLGVRGGLVLAAVMGVVLWPWPYRIVVPAVIEAEDARRVYASVAGRLTDAVEAGDSVAAGDVLARLENPELKREVEALRGRRDRQRLQLVNLERRQVRDKAAEAQIPTIRKALEGVEEQLRRREEDLERLTLRAPIAGTVLPPDRRVEASSSGELPTWSGTPLDRRNLGGYLETGTLFCSIGDPRKAEALLIIDQADIAFAHIKQRVEIQLDQFPGQSLQGTITQIAEIDLDNAPRTLAAHPDLPARVDERGRLRPLHASYQARVALDAGDIEALVGAPGRARIHCPPQSLASRLSRYLSRTFRLGL
jgi:putative peptide zinc metalloprotease protein